MKVPDGSGHFTANGVGYGGGAAPPGPPPAPARPPARRPPDLGTLLPGYAARPAMLPEVKRFGQQAGGATVLLKREDLTHTGSHKINNVLGQALLARRMGQTRVIAATG